MERHLIKLAAKIKYYNCREATVTDNINNMEFVIRHPEQDMPEYLPPR